MVLSICVRLFLKGTKSMTTLERPLQLCGLGQFANEAAKAGYQNPDGTVNLLQAQSVCKECGRLVPKNELDPQTLKAIDEAANKLSSKTNKMNDSFEKNV